MKREYFEWFIYLFFGHKYVVVYSRWWDGRIRTTSDECKYCSKTKKP